MNTNILALDLRAQSLYPVEPRDLAQQYAPFTLNRPVRGWARTDVDDSGILLYQDVDGLWWELGWEAGGYPGTGREERVLGLHDRKMGRTLLSSSVGMHPKAWMPNRPST